MLSTVASVSVEPCFFSFLIYSEANNNALYRLQWNNVVIIRLPVVCKPIYERNVYRVGIVNIISLYDLHKLNNFF